MNRIILNALGLLFFINCQAQNGITDSVKQRITAIENNIEEKTLHERMLYYKIPGVSIAVINNNKIEWAKAYGVLNAETNAPVTTESYFEAGSTTKFLVAAVVLHFADKGMIDLDTDVNNYLRSWKIPENEFTQKTKVTTRMLLSHMSGLPATNFPYEGDKGPTLIQALNGEPPALNKPAIIQRLPGSEWEYSNLGYVVIQLLLEDLTGKPLPIIMDEIIFQPLGMKSSTFIYPLCKEDQEKEALPHDESGAVREPAMLPTTLGQGGLISTPTGLAMFTIEMINAWNGASNKILSQEMVKKMFTRELDLGPSVFGVPLGQGLGVFIRGKGQNISFSHPGNSYPGSTCWLTAFPAHKKGLIVMANGFNGTLFSLEILDAVAREYNWPEFDEPENTEEELNAGTEDIQFVFVKGGPYEMGNTFDPGEGDPDELPVHTVTVHDFYMSEAEITYAQFDKFCELTGRKKPSDKGAGRGNKPVHLISWYDAKAFCDYYGYRLPTEAEWEYAAREGGKNIRLGNGKNIARDSEINFNAKKNKQTSYSEAGKYNWKPVPVKSFPPNSLGLYDMSGNVYEWCEDWYNAEFYKNSPADNPICIRDTSGEKITRGGCFANTPKFIRCSYREKRAPDSENFGFGFRVVKDLK